MSVEMPLRALCDVAEERRRAVIRPRGATRPQDRHRSGGFVRAADSGQLFVVGVIGIVAFTSTSKPRWMVAWSWIALFVVLAGVAGLAMTLAGDLRAIELAGR